MIKVIEKLLFESAVKAGIENPKIELIHPEDISHGDYSCNVALMYSKQVKISPKDLASKIAGYANESKKNRDK